MPSFQTIFRAVVMVGVGVVAVEGWRLYGPTNEQLKTLVTQGVDMVQSAIQRNRQATANVPPDPRTATPPAGEDLQPAAPLGAQPAAPLAQAEAPRLLPGVEEKPATPPNQPQIMQPATNPAPKAAETNRMPELMKRLEQLGAADTHLSPWGSEGQLFRFSCRAPLANAPTMTQHFESVAAEPSLAVEQVVAKVEAWRVAQRDGGTLRY